MLLWVLWECLIMSINNDNITFQETLMPKVLKSTCTKLRCLSTCKKSTSSLIYFWDIVKTLQTCLEFTTHFFLKIFLSLHLFTVKYFLAYIAKKEQTCYFGHACPHTPKMIVSILRRPWRLSACKKSTASFMFSLRYCTDIVKLLFWVLWTWPGYAHLKWYYQVSYKLSFLFADKK